MQPPPAPAPAPARTTSDMEIHPSQRRLSCEHCRKAKAKCQRMKPDDIKCLRCTLANVLCNLGEQRKVGRPKRKELAPSPTVRGVLPAKRRNPSELLRSRLTAVDQSKTSSPLAVQGMSDFLGVDVAFAHEFSDNRGFRLRADDQWCISTSLPATSTPGWLGLPIIMTDHLYCAMPPGAASSHVSTDSGPHLQQSRCASNGTKPFSARPPNWVAQGSSPPPLLASINQADFQGSLLPVHADARINPEFSTKHGLARTKVSPRCDIRRPPPHYLREHDFSSDPETVVLSNLAIDNTAAMNRLFRIAHGLQIRSLMTESIKSGMDLSLSIYRHGPLYLENRSLAEYVMASTQELVQIVTILVTHLRSTHQSNDQHSSHLVSVILNVYIRLLSFFQLFIEQLTDRTERFRTDPVIPIAGFTLNGASIPGPFTQGTLVTGAICHLLERLETLLGLNSISGGNALLSPGQVDMLNNKLDRSNDLSHTRGIMRPADMRNLYARMATVLEELSLNER